MKVMRTIVLAGLSVLLLQACQQGGVINDRGAYGAVSPEPRSDSRLAEINTQLGVEYMREGNYETALKKLDKALDVDPNYPRAYDVLGLLYSRLGENEKAGQNFKRAMELAPNDSNILNNYGQFLCRQGDPTQGQELFVRAVQNPLYATPEVAYTNAGICALNQQDKVAAEQHLRAALARNSEMPLALLQMSRLTYDDREYLAAKGYLERYAQVGRHTPESLLLGVQIEKQLGDADAADSYAMALKGKFPDSQEAQDLMSADP